MILIPPKVQILLWGDSLSVRNIELIGRACYHSTPAQTQQASDDFGRTLIEKGHESVIEHCGFTVQFIIDRGISHEIVRHRLASYTQESTRYCDYSKGKHIIFIIPPWVRCIHALAGYIVEDFTMPDSTAADKEWLAALLAAESTYRTLREEGWSPQKARSVLPNALKTTLFMTANYREWRHFFKLRCASSAHPQSACGIRPPIPAWSES